MHTINLNIFIYLIYVQAATIITIVIATYALYFIYKTKKLLQNKYIIQIQKYLLTNYDSKQAEKKTLDKHLIKLKYLILAITKICNIEKKTQQWEQYKLEFVKKYMLPSARKHAKKIRWFSRFIAAKTFALYAMPEDEKTINQLMQDSKPAVTIECIHAIVHLPTELLINTLIDQIAILRRKSYSLYFEPFKHLPKNKKSIIVKRLMKETDPYKRDICYRILMFFPPEPIEAFVYQDAKAKTIDLCLSAVRFIAYSEGEKALPFLHQMLYDDRWQIKVIILHALVDLNDTSSIDNIEKLLDDQEWWVKINAANALKKLRNNEKKL